MGFSQGSSYVYSCAKTCPASPESSLTVGENVLSTLPSRIPPFISPVIGHLPVLGLKSLGSMFLTCIPPPKTTVTLSIRPQPQPQRVGNTSLCSRPITLPGRRVGPPSPDLTLLSINYPLSSIFKHPLSTGSFLSFLLLHKQKEKRNPCFCFCSLLFPFLVNSSKDSFPPLSVGDWVLCKQMQFVRHQHL